MKSPSTLLSLAAAVAMIFGLSNSSAYAEQCPADVNQDQFVDGQDLAVLIAAWGTSGGCGGADMNGDGTIDGTDLASVLAEWGPCGSGGGSDGDLMVNKGINIDDTTIALTPSTQTFPCGWLKNSSQLGIGTIRTFHYDGNAPSWIEWAVQNNMKVIIGIDLFDPVTHLLSYTAQLNNLQTAYMAAGPTLKTQYDNNVIAIAIGNEAPASSLSLLQSGITYATTLTLPANAKYTSALNFDNDWSQNSYPPSSCTFTSAFLALEPLLDVVCFNCYGGYFTYGTQQFITVANSTSWQSTTNGGSVLLNQFGAIRFAMTAAGISKEFWVTETGWCSSTELSQNPAWSNLTNEKTFYLGFLGFSLTTPFTPQASSTSVLPPDKIIYFSVRDVAGGSGGAGFGLYTPASTLIPKF